jgi:hypothetical protein
MKELRGKHGRMRITFNIDTNTGLCNGTSCGWLDVVHAGLVVEIDTRVTILAPRVEWKGDQL